jgi:outer membrane protein assembly factor BamE (lipoprotein component of BamABCDE complex)
MSVCKLIQPNSGGKMVKHIRGLMSCVLVVTAIALLACDSRGRALEDLRLARLNEGESNEQDVRKVFGEPAAVRDIAGGKGLIYPLGPEGPHTLLMKIDAKGKYQGREDLLTRANFERVTRGMKEVDVLVMLGRPGRTEKYPLKQQSSWEWRFLDRHDTRIFVVMFDSRGTVASTAIEDDPRRFGGR